MPRSARAMKSLEVTVTIDHKGQLSIDSLVDIPIGAYTAVLVLEDQPIPPAQRSIEYAQAIFSQYIPPSRKLSEELILDRREEARNE